MKVLMVGGVFDETSGRESGYFRKLSKSLVNQLLTAEIIVVNGGTYQELLGLTNQENVTHLLWFCDIPNHLPKLVNDIKIKNPDLFLITSKNNRTGKYSVDQLMERMDGASSDLLVEFRDSSENIVASVWNSSKVELIQSESSIDRVAEIMTKEMT